MRRIQYLNARKVMAPRIIRNFASPGKKQVYLVAFAHFLHDTYTSFLSPALPLLIGQFGLSYTLAAGLRVAMRIPNLLNPFIGALTERAEKRYFIAFMPAITGIAMCFMGNMPGYFSLILLLFAAGISTSLFHVPAPVFLKKISGRKLGLGMSAFQVGGELSRTIGPMAAVGAISIWGLNGLYRMSVFGILLSCLLILRLEREKETDKRSGKSRSVLKQVTKTFAEGKKIFLLVIALLAIKSMTASVIATFLPTYLFNEGRTLLKAGAALSLVQAAAVAGVFTTGSLSDKIGREKLLLATAALSPFSVIFFLLYGGAFVFIPLLTIGFIAFSNTPVILALIQEAGFEYPSVANGIYMMLNFLSGALSVLLFGKVADITGLKGGFFLFSCLALIFFLPVPRLMNGLKRRKTGFGNMVK